MKLNDIFDRVAVINLDKRTDRMEEFDRQAKEIGLEYVRYSATESIPLKLHPTEACRISHLNVIHDAVQDGVNRLFVFEDDAQFVPDFNKKFYEFFAKLHPKWDMMYLGAWIHESEPVTDGVVRLLDSYSAHAYGINTEFLELALACVKQKNKPVDIALSMLHPRINAYCAKPALVGQAPGYSDIEKEYRDVTDKYL